MLVFASVIGWVLDDYMPCSWKAQAAIFWLQRPLWIDVLEKQCQSEAAIQACHSPRCEGRWSWVVR